MFTYFAARFDAIQSVCLRILIVTLIIFIPIGLFFGLLESEFIFLEALLYMPAIFTIVGVGVALFLCIIIKLVEHFSDKEELQEQPIDKPDISRANLPTEQRLCRKCKCEKMAVIERDVYIIDAYDFKCPECDHTVSINELSAIGLYTGGSLVLFIVWLAFLLNDSLSTFHDYFSYIAVLIVIFYLPISMAVKRWRYPITIEGKEQAEKLLDESSDPIYKATRMGNIWLSTVGFFVPLLIFIGFIIVFLLGAALLGIIHDEGISSLWTGRFWEVIQETVRGISREISHEFN